MKAESFGYNKQRPDEHVQQHHFRRQQSLGERQDYEQQGGGPEAGGDRRGSNDRQKRPGGTRGQTDERQGDYRQPQVCHHSLHGHRVEQAQDGACEHWTSDKEREDERRIEAAWCEGVARQAVSEQSDKRKTESDQIHEREARGDRRLEYRRPLSYERQPSCGDAYGLGVKRTEPRDDRQGSDRRTRGRRRARGC